VGLHQAIKPTAPEPAYQFAEEPEDDEDNFNEEDGQCQECGSTSWQILTYGRYSQWGYYTFGSRSRYVDYDSMETEGIDDDDGWECENGHSATTLIEEMLRAM
jgi:hypothetical protein